MDVISNFRRYLRLFFSNSVIEHGCTWKNKDSFAKEVRRLSVVLWIQTLAYEFPIEPHYLDPFVHWLPKPVQTHSSKLLTPRGLIGKPSFCDTDFMVDTTPLASTSRNDRTFLSAPFTRTNFCG